MTKSLEEKLQYLSGLTSQRELPQQSKFSYIDINFVIELLRQNLNMSQVAAIYGCSLSTISQRIKKQKPDFKPARSYTRSEQRMSIEEIIILFNQSQNASEVARKTNISLPTITRRLEKAGVKRISTARPEITQKRVASLYRILGSGLKVASTLGINKKLTYKRLEQAGVKLQGRWRRTNSFRDISELEVVKLYDNGEYYNKIAQIYDVNPSTIRRILVKNKRLRPFQKGNRPRREDISEIEVISLYDSGEPYYKIARRYNAASNTIRRILVKNDRKIRNSKKYRQDVSYHKVASYLTKYKDVGKVAKELNVSRAVIYRRLKDHNTPSMQIAGRNSV